MEHAPVLAGTLTRLNQKNRTHLIYWCWLLGTSIWKNSLEKRRNVGIQVHLEHLSYEPYTVN
jgi:hypothetical protein